MSSAASDTVAKINQLKELGPEWDSYSAGGIGLSALENAKSLVYELARALGSQFVPPVVGPTPDGGVVLIWRRGAGRPKLEVFLPVYEAPHYAVLQDRRLIESGLLNGPAGIQHIQHYAAL